MNEWEYSDNIDNHFSLDFEQSFDEQIGRLKSVSGGSFKRGSHNYYVLRALFAGHTIDDYVNIPSGEGGRPIRNVRTRVADLRNEWNICIGSRKVEGSQSKEYQIYGRGV